MAKVVNSRIRRRGWVCALGLGATATFAGCGVDKPGDDDQVVVRTGALLTCSLCGGNDPVAVDSCCTCQQTGVCTFTLPLLQGSNPTDIAMGAGSLISVNDRAVVTEIPDTGTGAMLSNAGTGPTPLGTALGTDTFTGTILSAFQVALRERAHVNGSVYSSVAPLSHQSTFTIDGVTKLDVTFARDTTWTRTVTWPATVAGPVSLEPGQTPTAVTLSPGAYQSVSVKRGRTLILPTGEYFFGSLTIEPAANLQVNAGAGPVRIYMKGTLVYRGTMTGTTTPGTTIPSLTIYTDDTSPQVVGGNANFTGVLIAPNADVGLYFGTHRGAFFGRSLTLFEQSVLRHIPDPFAFRGFGPTDRVSVTGGSLRSAGVTTDNFNQAETATAISRNGANFVVTVVSNDMSATRVNPKWEFFNDPNNGPQHRRIHDGASMMGWSFSTNGGYTFQYGGQRSPPGGWSVLYGDPEVAKPTIDDPYVFMAQEATSTPVFRATTGFDAGTNSVLDTTPIPDGHCVARSTDRGVTFPTIACVSDGLFHDGTALAAAFGAGNRRQVYLGGGKGINNQTGAFWRMDGETMAFTPLADPFAGGSVSSHPRLRVSGGILYAAVIASGGVTLNCLDAASSSTTWVAPLGLGVFSAHVSTLLADGTSLLTANDFSFDVGKDRAGQDVLRVIFTLGNFNGGPSVKTIECQVNRPGQPPISNCADGGWSAVDPAVAPFEPNIRFGGGQWMATWKVYAPASKLISVVAAALRDTGTSRTFDQRTLSFPASPCHSLHTFGGDYWGDYDEIGSFGDGRFFSGYTVNGPGCRYSGPFNADMHVGASILAF